MQVAVFGLGYVGTVTSAALAANGHQVRAVDVDGSKVSMLNSGRSPVVEPGLDELVARTTADGSLRATTDPAVAVSGAELSLICTGTPSSTTGSTDLHFVLRAVRDAVTGLRRCPDEAPAFHAIVVRSTVPPGTTEEHVEPLVAATLDGSPVAVGVGMCPEFLREGSALSDFYRSPLAVIGTTEPQVASAVRQLFSFLDDPVRTVSPRVAEALKYACNAYHATKVSFANEMGRLLKELGVDAREVMAMFCEDTKLNISAQYLAPGFAFGGSCLPKDLRSLLYLGRMSSLDLPLLSGVLTTNSIAVNDVVDRVIALGARSVALLGLSFKMLSDDLRESPYVTLAETLIGKGIDLRIFDPIVEPSKLVGTNLSYVSSRLPHLRRLLAGDPRVALDGADVALVSTSHPSVVEALCQRPPRVLIDLNGRLGDRVESIPGYEGVAWDNGNRRPERASR